MEYFNQPTVAEIKQEYRRLCSMHHPDKGGDVEIMKVINVEYKEALQGYHGSVSQDSQGKEHTYYYNESTEQEIIDKINELLSLNLTSAEISLIGTWIWITGETKQYKDLLKAAKCKWHSKRKCWFFSNQKKHRYNHKASLSDLANTYGCSTFDKKQVAIN